MKETVNRSLRQQIKCLKKRNRHEIDPKDKEIVQKTSL